MDLGADRGVVRIVVGVVWYLFNNVYWWCGCRELKYAGEYIVFFCVWFLED